MAETFVIRKIRIFFHCMGINFREWMIRKFFAENNFLRVKKTFIYVAEIYFQEPNISYLFRTDES